MTDAPKAGDVWDYPYLWARQSLAGETEGRKPRPSAVSVAVRRADGEVLVALLAITSQPPGQNRFALEVPETERKRATLDGDKRLWIILDEHNTDRSHQSYYLAPDSKFGTFSDRFRKQIQSAFLTALRKRKSFEVKRWDELS